MQMFFSVLLLISALALIISVLLQEGSEGGLGSTMGGSSAPASMWGQSGGNTKEVILQKVTMIAAALFIISALVLAAK